jgi:hypothetical protein
MLLEWAFVFFLVEVLLMVSLPRPFLRFDRVGFRFWFGALLNILVQFRSFDVLNKLMCFTWLITTLFSHIAVATLHNYDSKLF